MREMKRSTQVYAALLGVVAVAIVAMGLFGSVQQRWMDNMNLSSGSYGEWWLLQLVPKMYNFDNQIWAQIYSSEGELLLEEGYRVNHYPLRKVTFTFTGITVMQEGWRVELAVRSRYRGECQFRLFRMSRDESRDGVVLEELSWEESGFVGAEEHDCD